jgi:hypothetical protein
VDLFLVRIDIRDDIWVDSVVLEGVDAADVQSASLDLEDDSTNEERTPRSESDGRRDIYWLGVVECGCVMEDYILLKRVDCLIHGYHYIFF